VSKLRDDALYLRSIMAYRVRMALKGLRAAQAAREHPPTPLASTPPVTLFISSFNTRYPLELTIRTLRRYTAYPDYRLWIADNASTDGSREYLQTLAKEMPNVRLILNDAPRAHGDWLDEVYRTVDTELWFAVDSDMLFLGSDWLHDMVAAFVNDPTLYILSGEPKPGSPGVREPYGNIVDTGDTPSTWLFGIRTSLRDKVDASFGFYKAGINEATGNLLCYDTGGWLLHNAREQGLRDAVMPEWFRDKWHHFGSLSWTLGDGAMAGDARYQRVKRFQLRDIERRTLAFRG